MEAEKEENVSSTSGSVPSASVPGLSSIPAVAAPSFPPPIAPIPMVPHPPVVRPPTFRPPAPPQNGEAEASDSDTESEDGHYISEESRQVRERQEKAMQELLIKRRAAALAVPTNDKAVRERLRRLGEPMTLFGEQEMERRARLAQLMARLDIEGQLDKLLKAHEEETAPREEVEDEIPEYPFYTEGPRELKEARMDIAMFSMNRAAVRLQRAKRRRDDPDEDMDVEIKWALKQAEGMVLDCSNFGDDRPLSGCSFSRDGKILATCSLSGVAKLWEMPQVTNKVAVMKDHKERATDVVFSPVDDCLATASADRTAKLWKTDGTLLQSFDGHLDRLARIAFHPSGKYLGTTSFDKTWRLWDINTGKELLLQEGHSRSVYGIAFHHDGSLAASSGLDSLVRVWDLRTGRSILAFEGHIKPVLGVSFSPNGYHLASGGEDNLCRIWDLRMRKSLYTIPAHSNLISQVKFEPQEGYFLVTASYDMKVKIWSGRDFQHVKTLSGHEAKVTCLDITADGSHIATVSHDRTIKLWASGGSEEEEGRMDVD
ncbi:PREDICTED: U4/U6 small nuclear ribonucleoprotein PRP4-like protein [Tarenaya hassleriana]|uniref:U4/U6 small nuclear ribonucleoprotein PRP4-like protein n=1 Tax=Tarenaya hassleriana TaxID=28532 RepID=UPI00053C3810|nr:PREDICTED: U4/U6 small nuclear ribonucleoprotein PRP4-like protein [Tarenaya hassleriana]XP_010554803.1 PREDICTED: U4/U6 small nuclear ribonucleoprotein PRP4-like protein [Tarenaya hassleriana]